MVEKVCGFKDSRGKFHDTEYEAIKSSYLLELKEVFNGHYDDWYTVTKVAEYLIDKYNLLDRPTVPFWKTII